MCKGLTFLQKNVENIYISWNVLVAGTDWIVVIVDKYRSMDKDENYLRDTMILRHDFFEN